MRLPWRRNEGVYIEEGKPEKKKETLVSVAEKIIMRKMKSDPDGYGVEAAEKIKKMHHPEPKTVSDFLKELKEYRTVMKEAGLGGEGGKGMLQQILEVLPSIPALLQEARQIQQSMPQQPQIQGYQEPAQQIEQAQPQLTQQKKKKEAPQAQAPPSLEFDKLVGLLEFEPQQAWQELQNRGETEWIDFLSSTSYEELKGIIKKYAEHPQYGEHIKQFMEQYSHWLEDLVLCAHGVVKNA